MFTGDVHRRAGPHPSRHPGALGTGIRAGIEIGIRRFLGMDQTSGVPPTQSLQYLPLDWYDGILTGFAADAGSRRAWAVQCVAWDEETIDWRLYAFAPIAWETYGQAEALLSGPASAPLPLDDPDFDAKLGEKEEVFHEAGALLHSKRPPELVVLTATLGSAADRVASLADGARRAAYDRFFGKLAWGALEYDDMFVPRERFQAYAEAFFGPVELPARGWEKGGGGSAEEGAG
jgi:hypothetical protein